MWSMFWTWHRRDPAEVPVGRMRSLALATAIGRARADAMACHASQFDHRFGASVLTTDDLTPMRWPREYYLESEAAP